MVPLISSVTQSCPTPQPHGLQQARQMEGSDKMWSTGKGSGKPLQYSCLENPMNSMKMVPLRFCSKSGGKGRRVAEHLWSWRGYCSGQPHIGIFIIWVPLDDSDGEGNGTPLQCSCLENPRDGAAWWAAVYGVTQSWTRLRWLCNSSSRWFWRAVRVEKHCSFTSWHPTHRSSCYSVAKSCLTLCDPMDCIAPGFPVLHHLPEFTQTQVHWFGDAIQPSHPLSPSFPPAFSLPQHQGLFHWVSSS